MCITLILSCKSTPTTTKYKWTGITYSGEETPFLTGTRWVFLSNVGQSRYVEFQSGGIMVFGDWDPIYLTWQRNGNTIQAVNLDGFSYWEGIYDPETKKIIGSVENTYGDTGTFMMEQVTPGDSQ